MRRGFAWWFCRTLARAWSEEGVSLTEVLVAAVILSLVLGPMLDFSAYLYNGQAYQKAMKAQLATSYLEYVQNLTYRRPYASSWPAGGSGPASIDPYEYTATWEVDNPFAGTWESTLLRRVEMVVQCTNCRDTSEFRVVTYIARITPASSTK